MFKMRKKNKSWLEMNPVVWAVMIFVGIIAAGAITVMVMPLVNRGKDTKVMKGLTSLKTAISLFMIDTNGKAPCFNSNVTDNTQSRLTAFAVSGLLHSDISSDAVRNNLSVLDVMWQSNFWASSPTTYTSCRSNDVNLSLAWYWTARVIEAWEWRFIYMNINVLTSTTFKDSTAGVNCDIYSEWQIFEWSFLANPSGSPSMNV